MRKLIAILALGLTVSAHADGHGFRHPGHYEHRDSYGWVAPAIIGGVVTYALTHPAPQPVYVQPVPNYQYPPAPLGYHYENIVDANCNCWRLVMVPN